ncbi:MAG TPA: LytTR family DNA-binding domain-containing protein [Burkholderiales bacterium]|nr:LytTR family DNA-binding domain-containing protein [Burkholderiales bacterium]
MSEDANKLRVAITDDEAPARSRLKDLLEDIAGSIPLKLVGEAGNGRELLSLLEAEPADVVLLDIRMPEMDGIEVAQHLLKLPDPPHVVFTTAYDDYALKAFELHAIDYLVKPIRLRRLHDALARARSITRLSLDVLQNIAPEARTHLGVQERGRVTLIPIGAVLYLRAELKYVTLRTAEREYVLEESLLRLEQEFAERFVRIHRSCLVAREHIEGFEKETGEAGEPRWTVKMRGLAERLPVSRRQQHIVRELGRNVL